MAGVFFFSALLFSPLEGFIPPGVFRGASFGLSFVYAVSAEAGPSRPTATTYHANGTAFLWQAGGGSNPQAGVAEVGTTITTALEGKAQDISGAFERTGDLRWLNAALKNNELVKATVYWLRAQLM